jgi:hypothetical protein
MQQCEDFAPPPEPSGQRKQMAALCMLQRTERQGCGPQQVEVSSELVLSAEE